MVSYSVANVINYLDNREYNSNTLLSDIDIVGKMYVSNEQFEKKDELGALYMDMLHKRVLESKNFHDAICREQPSYIMRKIEICHFYPFRLSRDPIADRDLIFKMNNIVPQDKDSAEEFVNLVYSLLVASGYEVSQKFKDEIYKIVYNFDEYTTSDVKTIDIQTMRKAKYVSRISSTPFPESKDDARKLFDEVGSKESIGFYGEYLGVEFIKEHLMDAGDELYWVSKDLGDGYGFDVVVYNYDKNKFIAYELKATEKTNDGDNDGLTITESAIKELSKNKENNYKYRELKFEVHRGFPGISFAHDYSNLYGWRVNEKDEWKNTLLIDNTRTPQEINAGGTTTSLK